MRDRIRNAAAEPHYHENVMPWPELASVRANGPKPWEANSIHHLLLDYH